MTDSSGSHPHPEQKYEGSLVVQAEESLPLGKAGVLGLQHVLAMDVYVVPFLIATILSLSIPESAILIQATFIATGLATLIQSQFCMRMPIAQGPSYIPIGATVGVALAAGGGLDGLSAAYSGMIPGAILIVLLGFTGVFRKIINKLIPPIVGGTIIIVVGIALIPLVLQNSIFTVHGAGTIQSNAVLALFSAALLIALVTLGLSMGKRGVWIRLASVMLALVGGCLLASVLGLYNGQAIADAPWFVLPRLAVLDFELAFSWSATLTMLIVYAVLMAETSGTWFAISAIINRPLKDEQIDRGVTGEGLGCLVSAMVGSTPVTGYAANAGIIAITGIASRWAFVAAGIWLFVFGLFGKLSVAIASIPSPVIGGVFVVICSFISLSGFRVVRHIELNERNMFVMGVPIITALFIDLAPAELIQSLPVIAQYFLSSAIATGAMMAIILHQILPKSAGHR